MMCGSSIFSEIRFFLAGFSPEQSLKCKSKILSEGGIIYDEYSPDCTHVVVHKLAFDDPICVTTRRDKKTLVATLWLKDSLQCGKLSGIDNIMYRPVKDLNGIPGANKLVICLTGYVGMDREDLKVYDGAFMGARFSKPLVVSRVTHLICYKFEGAKHELAKKVNVTKIVNHRWLVDCLDAWKILQKEPCSSRSGYEFDMMEAETKDSEDEVEVTSGRNYNGITKLQNKIDVWKL